MPKSYFRDRKSGPAQVIDAFFEGQQEKQKLKNEIRKLQIQSHMRQQEKFNAMKSQMIVTALKERMQKPQNFTPEQEYLKKRFMEENPIAAMALPEEGQEMTGVSFPDSVSRPDDKGMYQMKSPATDPKLQVQMLDAKVAEMQNQGKKVHPAILSLLSRMKKNMPEFEGREKNKDGIAYDPETGKPIDISGKLGKKGTLSDYQRRLDYLSDPMNEPEEGTPEYESITKEKNFIQNKIRELTGFTASQKDRDLITDDDFETSDDEVVDGDTKELLEEYNTTTDQERARELEDILAEKGIQFQ